VHVEFLIAKRSNSGVKLHGHYEIQIADSHGVKEPTADDCGGVYPRAEQKPKYHHIDKGIPPKTNAARAAGEWQTLDIIFLAPRFDSAGKKTANARLVKVVLNGQVIHENVELLTPTGHAWKNPEMAKGRSCSKETMARWRFATCACGRGRPASSRHGLHRTLVRRRCHQSGNRPQLPYRFPIAAPSYG